VTVNGASSGTGNGTVSYLVAANPSSSPRTSSLLVAGRVFKITQLGDSSGCSVVALNIDQVVSGVLANTDCQSPVRGANYFADRYTFNGTANQGVAIRTNAAFDTFLSLLGPDGTVIADDDDGAGDGFNSRIPFGGGFFALPASGTYTIEVTSRSTFITGSYSLSLTSGMAGCSYGIAPVNKSFNSAGGPGTIAVTTGGVCPWTAITSVNWVTITGGGSGAGNGTVSYTVAANPSGTPRSGSVLAAGLVLNITQLGDGGFCSLAPITLGQSINGTLTNTDCQSPVRGANYFADRYTFNGTANQAVAIRTNATFDAFLYLLRPDGTVLAADDDGAGDGLNSRIPSGSGFLALPTSGTYTIEVTSRSTSITGSYSVSLTGGIAGCSYGIAPLNQSFNSAGGPGNIAVTTGSTCDWTAISDANWVTIIAGNSGTGNGTVSYTVAANPSGSPRNGNVLVAGFVFNITQLGNPSGCSVTPLNVNQLASGILANTDCQSPVRGNGYFADRYTFTGTANQAVAIRTNTAFDAFLYLLGPDGTVLVADDDGGGFPNARIPAGSGVFALPTTGTYTIEVTSRSTLTTGSYSVILMSGTTGCNYGLTPSGQSFNSTGGTGNIAVTTGSNCTWTSISDANWVTINTGVSGTGNGSVSYTLAANPGSSPRSANVFVAGLAFNITQFGDSTSCNVTALNINQVVSGSLANTDCQSPVRGSGYFADRYSFTGTANQAVTISLTSAAFDTFLYLLGPDGTVLVADDDGAGSTDSRIPAGTGFFTLPTNGTYTIEATSFSRGATGSYTLSLTTIQANCVYGLSKSSETFSSSGGSDSVSVTAAGGCNWTATSNSSFITVTSGASGSGNGVASYSVAVNTSGTGRSGTLTIAGQTFIVTQSPGATCSFSINPTLQNIGAGASSGAVSVVSSLGCSWTAVSNNSFITITSGVSGSGNGTVFYSVSANGGSARVGTMTIAGRTFSINQSAGGTSAVTITSIAPVIPTARPSDQSVSVFGGGFQPGLTVSVMFPSGGPPVTLSGTQIQNVTSTSFVMIAVLGSVGNWTIRVNNPDGGQSNIFAFPVQAGGSSPIIASITPAIPLAIGADQRIDVFGSGFQPGLIVTVGFSFGGSATLSGTQIQNVTPTSFVMIATLGIPATYTIRVTNPDLGQSNVFTFIVSASSGGCNYLIAPMQQQFGTGGGDGVVDVTAPPGCGWTATSNAGFLSITSGTSGIGNGTVRYTVAPNTGAARMGTLTIGDQTDRQTFTVTQGAGSPNLRTITLVEPLPKIIDPVTIDGTTQPGFAGAPIIEINGVNLRNKQGGDGLQILGGSSTIRGLVLNRFSSTSRNSAIVLSTLGNNIVEGCYVGPDPSGTAAFTVNSGSSLSSPSAISVGISINSSSNNRIGGTTSSARNLISGIDGSGIIITERATENKVQGNYIGTDVTGSFSLGLQLSGVVIQGASGNTIGGTEAGAGNLISGNKNYGVFLQEDAGKNRIVGNIIGTNGAGTEPVGNNFAGVFVYNPSTLPGSSLDNTIGGTTPAARNLISGNDVYGVVVGAGAAGTLVQGNYIGTNLSGSSALPNAHGVTVTQAPGSTVGGADPGARNLISGNRLSGISIGLLNVGGQTGGTGTTVQGNYIGTDAAGTGAVGNQRDGIFVELNSDGNTIQENRIAFNGSNGIRIPNVTANPGTPGVRISLLSNDIYSNTALGIDLGEVGVTPNDLGDIDGGANFQQNFPVLTSFLPVAANQSDVSANELMHGNQSAKRNSIASATSVTVSGAMTDSKPNTSFIVHWYFSADSQCTTNQARTPPLLSNKVPVTTDGNGNGTFTFPFDFPAGITNGVINCTATDPQGNTSEFSACLVVSAGAWQPVVLNSQQVAEMKAWTVGGRSYVYVKPQFPDAGYRVANWGQAVRSSNDFTADAVVEKFSGSAIQSVVSTAQIYDLGPLTNGSYNFNFKTSGTLAKTLQFTVSPTVPPPNPIDTAREFVKQQYRDFLNREPDQAGEDFWTDNITKCSNPARRPAGQTEAQCTLRQRETTSGAFFLSPEFQYTGYYVYRMYQGALGRQPKLSEFLVDAQFVGNGIIVNGQLSAAKINQNKAAFAQQFVNCMDATKYRCAEFKAIYDGLTNTQFVDKLFQTTGVNATATERIDLVNSIGASQTRGSIVQKVVDGINVISEGNQQFTTTYGQAFYNAEFNRAFVQLEYFGYMKRDPDDAGYAFWLGKLNQFGGNFVNAEMVLAFISSPEYRARFGQP
jgi:hypothetical protein